MKQINDFSERIDLHDSNVIITYGAGAQKRLSDFSEAALEQVRARDMDQIGETLTNLVADLKVDPTESKGFLSFFKKGLQQASHERKHSAEAFASYAHERLSSLALIAPEHVHLPAWRGFIRQTFRRVFCTIFK